MDQSGLFMQGSVDFDREAMHEWLLTRTLNLSKEFKARTLLSHLHIFKTMLAFK